MKYLNHLVTSPICFFIFTSTFFLSMFFTHPAFAQLNSTVPSQTPNTVIGNADTVVGYGRVTTSSGTGTCTGEVRTDLAAAQDCINKAQTQLQARGYNAQCFAISSGLAGQVDPTSGKSYVISTGCNIAGVASFIDPLTLVGFDAPAGSTAQIQHLNSGWDSFGASVAKDNSINSCLDNIPNPTSSSDSIAAFNTARGRCLDANLVHPVSGVGGGGASGGTSSGVSPSTPLTTSAPIKDSAILLTQSIQNKLLDMITGMTNNYEDQYKASVAEIGRQNGLFQKNSISNSTSNLLNKKSSQVPNTPVNQCFIYPAHTTPTASITVNGLHEINQLNGQGFVINWKATNGNDTTGSYVTVDGVKIIGTNRLDYPFAIYDNTPADAWGISSPLSENNTYNDNASHNVALDSGAAPAPALNLYETYDFDRALNAVPFTPTCNEAAYTGLTPPCYKKGNYGFDHMPDFRTGHASNLSVVHTIVYHYIVKQTGTNKQAEDTLTVHITPNGNQSSFSVYSVMRSGNVYKFGTPQSGLGVDTIIYPGDHAVADLQGFSASSWSRLSTGCVTPSVGVENIPAGVQASISVTSPPNTQECLFTAHLDLQTSSSAVPGVYILYTWMTNALGEKYYNPQRFRIYDRNISINIQPERTFKWNSECVNKPVPVERPFRRVISLVDASTDTSGNLTDSTDSSNSAVDSSAQPSDVSFDHDLSYGTTDDSSVTDLQNFLTTQGDYSGPVTGNYLTLTKTGVKKFQTNAGITPTGYFGPLSRAAANQKK